MSLNTSLLQGIQSGSNASELLQLFNETYKNSSEEERRRSFHLFVCAAMEHDHTELVRHLLADTRCMRETSDDSIVKFLCLAIDAGKVPFVKIFLRSRESLKLLRFPSSINCSYEHDIKLIYEMDSQKTFVSPIEYACLCDQREILKLLVTYDTEQDRKMGKPVIYACRNVSVLRAVFALVYHTVKFRTMLTLPSIVQLIFDMSSDDNTVYLNRSRYRFQTLVFLINMAKDLVIKSINGASVTFDECEMIAETARILLSSCSVITSQEMQLVTTDSEKQSVITGSKSRLVVTVSDNQPVMTGLENHMLLDGLLHLTLTTSHHFLRSSLWTIPRVNSVRLLSGLIKALLRHNPIDVTDIIVTGKIIFHNVLDAAVLCVKRYNFTTDTSSRQLCREMMDIMADIFNYCLLPNADIMTFYFFGANERNLSLEGHVSTSIFDLPFVYIAGYSSESGHSDRFVRLMMNCVSASQISQLKIRLEHMKAGSRDIDRFPEYVQTALKLVGAVKVPFSLQHLSRHAVIYSMSYRCIGAVDLSSLCLSRCAQQDILTDIE